MLQKTKFEGCFVGWPLLALSLLAHPPSYRPLPLPAKNKSFKFCFLVTYHVFFILLFFNFVFVYRCVFGFVSENQKQTMGF